MKILIVLGTRPEIIKVAPIIKELNKYPDRLRIRICITGQHRQMVKPLLRLFEIKPHYDLNIMRDNQLIGRTVALILSRLENLLKKEKPDYLLAQGDTSTAMAASLASFYHKIKIAHVEAGLRTEDKNNPFPEEVNRKICDVVSDICFAPTHLARKSLLKEGIPQERILVTGNTVVDALKWVLTREFSFKDTALGDLIKGKKKIIILTVHRRESFGRGLVNIYSAVRRVIRRNPEACIVYPVHPNPNVRNVAYSMLRGFKNILLIPPLDYQPFIHLIQSSYFIVTDSGGLLEEAATLNKPVLILRNKTERPEAVKCGIAKIVGTKADDIIKEIEKLLRDAQCYKGYYLKQSKNIYGDGKASQRIVNYFLNQIFLSRNQD